MNPTPPDLPQFWNTLDRIRLTLQLDRDDFLEMMEYTPGEYARARLAQKEPDLRRIMKLGDRLNLGFEPLMTGKIDYVALACHFFGKGSILPERYAANAYSKRRASSYILDFLESEFGWYERQNCLRQFQMNESMFQNLDSSINIFFNLDLFDYLVSYKVEQSAIIRVGQHAAHAANLPTPVLKSIRKSRDKVDLIEMMTLEVIPTYFDRNYIYQIKSLDSSGYTITAIPNPEAYQDVPFHFRAPLACLARQGVASALPTYIGLKPSISRKTACIHEGDSSCRLEYRFS